MPNFHSVAETIIRSAVMVSAGLLLTVVSFPWTGSEAFSQTEPKRIVLIGATANAAPALINQALAAGHEVIGLARRPEAVETSHERFKAIKGDVYDIDSIARVLTGDEVVVSYIDIAMTFGKEVAEGVDLFSRGTTNIIAAMKKKGNRRLIVASAIGAENIILDEPADDASIFDKLAWSRRHKYEDVRRMETIVEASELDYIILRLPHLVDGGPKGTPNVVVNKNAYNIAVKNQDSPRILTRIDLANFILEQLDSDEYLETRIALFN